jgi:hypothetical protein
VSTSVDWSAHEVLSGGRLPCDDGWHGVLAIVVTGTVELRSRHGIRLQPGPGDMFGIAALDPMVLSNTGDTTATIATVRRVPAGGGGR